MDISRHKRPGTGKVDWRYCHGPSCSFSMNSGSWLWLREANMHENVGAPNIMEHANETEVQSAITVS